MLLLLFLKPMKQKRNNGNCNSRAYCRKYGCYFKQFFFFLFHKFLCHFPITCIFCSHKPFVCVSFIFGIPYLTSFSYPALFSWRSIASLVLRSSAPVRISSSDFRSRCFRISVVSVIIFLVSSVMCLTSLSLFRLNTLYSCLNTLSSLFCFVWKLFLLTST